MGLTGWGLESPPSFCEKRLLRHLPDIHVCGLVSSVVYSTYFARSSGDLNSEFFNEHASRTTDVFLCCARVDVFDVGGFGK